MYFLQQIKDCKSWLSAKGGQLKHIADKCQTDLKCSSESELTNPNKVIGYTNDIKC